MIIMEFEEEEEEEEEEERELIERFQELKALYN